MYFSHTEPDGGGTEGNERTSEIPDLATGETEDAFPAQPSVKAPLGDLDSLTKTVLLDGLERIKEVDRILSQLIQLLEQELRASEGNDRKIRLLGEVKGTVISARECFPSDTSSAWEDSDPSMPAVVPAMRFDQDGKPYFPSPKNKRVPVEIMQAALNILEPLLGSLEEFLRQRQEPNGGGAVNFLQKVHLSLRQAVTLLHIH